MEILEVTKKDLECGKAKLFKIKPFTEFPEKINYIVGIDPGSRKLGISIICKEYFEVAYIQQNRYELEIERALSIQNTIKQIVPIITEGINIAIIEGASHGANFGQVQLAEIRAAIMLQLTKLGYQTYIVPPLSIRKAVFGNGRTKAKEEWKDIPPDSAASLACAIAYSSIF